MSSVLLCTLATDHPFNHRFSHGHNRMVPNVASFIVKPVDFCCYLYVCISGEAHAIYPRVYRGALGLKLYRIATVLARVATCVYCIATIFFCNIQIK